MDAYLLGQEVLVMKWTGQPGHASSKLIDSCNSGRTMLTFGSVASAWSFKATGSM